jgi:hypothetical protein
MPAAEAIIPAVDPHDGPAIIERPRCVESAVHNHDGPRNQAPDHDHFPGLRAGRSAQEEQTGKRGCCQRCFAEQGLQQMLMQLQNILLERLPDCLT